MLVVHAGIAAFHHIARSPNIQIAKYRVIDYTLPLTQLPDPLPIEPLTRPFDVTITPPGSKSITNRAYVLAALAQGESRIVRPLRADDTDLLLKALCTLGAEARWVPGQTGDGSEDVLIRGVGGRFPRGGYVNLGDGGTPTRFMIACACLAKEPVVVDGSPRMRERPIAEGVEMLRQLGAKIEYVEEEGRLPVRVTPSEGFKGGELTVGKTASSQFISAVMLIAPWLERGVSIRLRDRLTSASYVALTDDVLAFWRIDSEVPEQLQTATRISVSPGRVSANEFAIDCDASSSIYWHLAYVVSAGSELSLPNHDPSREVQPDDGAICELFGFLARGGHGVRIDARSFPDAAVALAVASAGTSVQATLTGLHTLRVKETDRIAALANELRKVGCGVETTEDSITITPIDATGIAQRDAGRPHARASADASFDPPAEPGAKPLIIETYNDHRMAMAFAVLGLRVPGIQIRNPACVKKSYPTFWKDFQKLYDNPRK